MNDDDWSDLLAADERRLQESQEMRDEGERLAHTDPLSIRALDIYETALHRMHVMTCTDPKAYADCARNALDKVAKLKETAP